MSGFDDEQWEWVDGLREQLRDVEEELREVKERLSILEEQQAKRIEFG